MPRQLTLADIITNALDKDYALGQAATDLGELMNERELIKRRYGPGAARLTELERMIPLQEMLDAPQWLTAEEGERLIGARPERNLLPTAIEQQMNLLLPNLPRMQVALESLATERAATQLEAHERVREASRTRGRVSIEPVLPVDILGAYVLLPRL